MGRLEKRIGEDEEMNPKSKIPTKEEVIQIEIMRSEFMENRFNCRIGDIKGSTEHSNATKEDILDEIGYEINNLKEVQGVEK